MQEKEKREVLNAQKIATHYRQQLWDKNAGIVLVALIVISVLFYLITSSYPEHKNQNHAIILFWIITLIYFIWVKWDCHQIQKGNFRIIEAPLTKIVGFYKRPFARYHRSYLIFGKKGRYIMPVLPAPLYKGSPYETTTKELMERSEIGEKFYLIKRHKYFVYMVYSTRNFVWDGELHEQ
jgi:hypothetical protein